MNELIKYFDKLSFTKGGEKFIYKVLDSAAARDITSFTPAANLLNITSGDNYQTILSKISKWFDSFANVAFSGDYQELNNKPDIPSVGSGNFIVKVNNTNVASFNANQNDDTELSLSIPKIDDSRASEETTYSSVYIDTLISKNRPQDIDEETWQQTIIDIVKTKIEGGEWDIPVDIPEQSIDIIDDTQLLYNKTWSSNKINSYIGKGILTIKVNNEIKATFGANQSNNTEFNINLPTMSTIQFEVVDTLPISGNAGTIYFIKNNTDEDDDTRDEYAWINDRWENIGKHKVTNLIAGTAIDINNDASVNVKYDTDTLYVNNNGELAVKRSSFDGDYLKKIKDMDAYTNEAPVGEIVMYVGPTVYDDNGAELYHHGYIYERVATTPVTPKETITIPVNTDVVTFSNGKKVYKHDFATVYNFEAHTPQTAEALDGGTFTDASKWTPLTLSIAKVGDVLYYDNNINNRATIESIDYYISNVGYQQGQYHINVTANSEEDAYEVAKNNGAIFDAPGNTGYTLVQAVNVVTDDGKHYKLSGASSSTSMTSANDGHCFIAEDGEMFWSELYIFMQRLSDEPIVDQYRLHNVYREERDCTPKYYVSDSDFVLNLRSQQSKSSYYDPLLNFTDNKIVSVNKTTSPVVIEIQSESQEGSQQTEDQEEEKPWKRIDVQPNSGNINFEDHDTQYSAGSGLSMTDNVITANVDNETIIIDENGKLKAVNSGGSTDSNGGNGTTIVNNYVVTEGDKQYTVEGGLRQVTLLHSYRCSLSEDKKVLFSKGKYIEDKELYVNTRQETIYEHTQPYYTTVYDESYADNGSMYDNYKIQLSAKLYYKDDASDAWTYDKDIQYMVNYSSSQDYAIKNFKKVAPISYAFKYITASQGQLCELLLSDDSNRRRAQKDNPSESFYTAINDTYNAYNLGFAKKVVSNLEASGIGIGDRIVDVFGNVYSIVSYTFTEFAKLQVYKIDSSDIAGYKVKLYLNLEQEAIASFNEDIQCSVDLSSHLNGGNEFVQNSHSYFMYEGATYKVIPPQQLTVILDTTLNDGFKPYYYKCSFRDLKTGKNVFHAYSDGTDNHPFICCFIRENCLDNNSRYSFRRTTNGCSTSHISQWYYPVNSEKSFADILNKATQEYNSKLKPLPVFAGFLNVGETYESAEPPVEIIEDDSVIGDITVEKQTVYDSELSTNSTNAVQNKVVTNALNRKVNSSDIANVARTGDYNDLRNKVNAGTGIDINGNNTVAVKIDNETIKVVEGRLKAELPNDYRITVDTQLSGNSSNPIANNAVQAAIEAIRQALAGLPVAMELSGNNLILKDQANNAVSTIDTTPFIKDGILETAQLIKVAETGVDVEAPYFKFVFNVDANKAPIYVSLKDFISVQVETDDYLSSVSTNPVQNKIVNDALNTKLNKNAFEYNEVEECLIIKTE